MSAVITDFDVAALLSRLATAPRRITADSRLVRAGDAFAAFPGLEADGRAFIPDAIARGAGAVLWEALAFHWDAAWRVSNVAVEDLKAKTPDRCAENGFAFPQSSMGAPWERRQLPRCV